MNTLKRVLDENDVFSATWVKLEAHLQARLTTLREQNDKLQTEVETSVLRGKISEVKYFLALSKGLNDRQS